MTHQGDVVTAYSQYEYARSHNWKDMPSDLICYHANYIQQCEAFNCQVDSGRLTSKNLGGVFSKQA